MSWNKPGRVAYIAGLTIGAVGRVDLRDVVQSRDRDCDAGLRGDRLGVRAHAARAFIQAAPWLGTGRGAHAVVVAGRPPALYDYGPADYTRATRARTTQLLGFVPVDGASADACIDRDYITYVYLGPNPKPLT